MINSYLKIDKRKMRKEENILRFNSKIRMTDDKGNDVGGDD